MRFHVVRGRRALAALGLALAAVACGGGGGGPAGNKYGGTGGTGGGAGGGGGGGGGAGSTSASIAIGTGQVFDPSATTVPVGTAVTWTWNSCSNDPYYGETCVKHNVTWDDGSAPASPSQSSGTYSRTFATAGTYAYHCTIHGTTSSGMRGTVTVQ